MTDGVSRWERWSRALSGVAVAMLAVVALVVGCSLDASPTTSGRSLPELEGGVPLATDAPDPNTVPPPLWAAAGRGGNLLAGFEDTPYNNDGAPAPEVLDSPNIEGAQAIHYEMPGGGTRTELVPSFGTLREGDQYYFGFAWFLPPDFPVAPGSWQVIAQWKNTGEGSPPVQIGVGEGQFWLSGGFENGEPWRVPIGPARTGTQTNIVVHLRFSSDPEVGEADVWMNGQHRIESYFPPSGTLYEDDTSYLKIGIYRDDEISQTASLFLNDARIASSYESAAALVTPHSSR